LTELGVREASVQPAAAHEPPHDVVPGLVNQTIPQRLPKGWHIRIRMAMLPPLQSQLAPSFYQHMLPRYAGPCRFYSPYSSFIPTHTCSPPAASTASASRPTSSFMPREARVSTASSSGSRSRAAPSTRCQNRTMF
jgi:hypothetical protein